MAGEGRDPGACSSGQHGIAGVVRGVDAPCGDALQLGDDGVGVAQVFALVDQLAGDRDITLVYSVLAGAQRPDCSRGEADDQDQEERGEFLPSTHASAVSAFASAQEVTFSLVERRVAGGVGADPSGGACGGRQQAAAVEVGRVARAACPLCCDVVQSGPDDPVGVSFSQPGVAQQRPGGQQHLVADLHGAGRKSEQPLGGESLQHRLHIAYLGGALTFGQFRPRRPIGGVHTVAAGGGQAHEDLPGRSLLVGGEVAVGALGAVGDGPFDAAGPFIVGEDEHVSAAAAPGLIQSVRQQRQHACAGDRPKTVDVGRRCQLATAHLPQEDVRQGVVDTGTRLLGRLDNGHPQLPLGHRRHQEAVLDRVGQPRVVGATGLEIGAHSQHDQSSGCLIRPVPGGGGRVQGYDERAPLRLIGALGKELLELVDYQQQPPLLLFWRRAVRISRRPGWLPQGGLAGGEGEPGRIGVQPAPHGDRVRSRQ